MVANFNPATGINLPLDVLGNPIPVTALGTTVFVAVNTSTARVQLTAGSDLIYFVCSVDCYINFGGATVDAARDGANPLMLAGERPLRVPAGATYIAAISRDGAESGKATVSMMITK